MNTATIMFASLMCGSWSTQPGPSASAEAPVASAAETSGSIERRELATDVNVEEMSPDQVAEDTPMRELDPPDEERAPSSPGSMSVAPSEPAEVAKAETTWPARKERMGRGAWVPQRWPVEQPCEIASERQTCMTLMGEIFGGYRYSQNGGDVGSQFTLDRAEVGTGFIWRPLERFTGGVVAAVEAVRSAGPQSVIGIDGDSLVVRMLEAYGHGALRLGPIDIGVRAGLVPERWIEQAEKGYDTRGIDALSSDRLFFDRSDLGATLTVSGWRGRVELDLGFVNGEGRAQRELNLGKNTNVMLTVRPVQKELPQGPITLSVHGLYRDGSFGIASTRNHRAAAATTFASPWAYAGVEYVHAFGFDGQAGLRTDAFGVWVSGHIVAPYLGVMAKYDRIDQDKALADTAANLITAAVFSDAFGYLDRNRRRLRLYLGYQHEAYGAFAGPFMGTPEAAATHRVLVQLQARGLHRMF